ncbi:hypothetical protein C8J56DRAFT_1101601 [Mycena floridula]|nr:hypothetical protein C8J56DRAFT_1101601 [Mycena floridula]
MESHIHRHIGISSLGPYAVEQQSSSINAWYHTCSPAWPLQPSSVEVVDPRLSSDGQLYNHDRHRWSGRCEHQTHITQLDQVQQVIGRTLSGFLDQPSPSIHSPERIFALACRCGLEEVAKKAAKVTLSLKGPSAGSYTYSSLISSIEEADIPEYELLTATELNRLHKFRDTCFAKAARNMATSSNLLDHDHPFFQGGCPNVPVWWIAQSEGHSADCGCTISMHEASANCAPASWFSIHIRADANSVYSRLDLHEIRTNIQALSGEALNIVSRCPLCSKRGPGDLKTESPAICARISSIINQVHLIFF